MRIRRGREADRQAIDELLASGDMGGHVDLYATLVAEVEGRVVGSGFLEWSGGEPYLRAIVVHPDGRGGGVGSALVKALIAAASAVKVVSRGGAAPFYRRLGFQPVSWTDIDRRYQDECEACVDRLRCQPQPMVFNAPE